eukprot:CAMPEP_0172488802 /NCGR_PEP_ID=MMETSP1066-20121228/18531_1 /TAXON_ID=671091 /ORGANISM="Coscinodiscus wailesii, Strain CCMP2513" /LENGTH=194 /DNA_ID=CAMNT_0013256267 /DNA_START=38 /DNA_END=622 /DNA_ORIENTATION=+
MEARTLTAAGCRIVEKQLIVLKLALAEAKEASDKYHLLLKQRLEENKQLEDVLSQVNNALNMESYSLNHLTDLRDHISGYHAQLLEEHEAILLHLDTAYYDNQIMRTVIDNIDEISMSRMNENDLCDREEETSIDVPSFSTESIDGNISIGYINVKRGTNESGKSKCTSLYRLPLSATIQKPMPELSIVSAKSA